MPTAPNDPVDPHTRWGVYATLALYVVGLAAFAAGLAGVDGATVPGFFLWAVAQVAVGLSTLVDAFALGREGVDWSSRRYLYGLGALVVPPLVVLYVYHRRRRVRTALRGAGTGAAVEDRSPEVEASGSSADAGRDKS